MSTHNSSKRWKCPICDRRAYNLLVDSYLMEAMKICDGKDLAFGADGKMLIGKGINNWKEGAVEVDLSE